MRNVYLVMAQDKGPDDAEAVSYVVGVYATRESAESARRRHEDMRDPQTHGISYIDEQQVRP